MNTATLSTKGQLVIPNHLRKALHLHPGDQVNIALSGEKLVLQRANQQRATLVTKKRRKLLVAPPGAPPMTTESVKVLLADFP